jgi:hypothetical protein
MIFFYNPGKAIADQWAAREWDQTTGIHGCACYQPNERWVFVADPGEVYVVGQGDDGDEAKVFKEKHSYISSVRCVAGGFAYAVGTGRKVFRRTGPNRWERLSTKELIASLPADLGDAGFSDIGGYSAKDVYACGSRGDLWHFDGKRWKALQCPTNANLEKLVCATDGNVYITTNRNEIVVGRDNKWKVMAVDIGDQLLQEIVSYKKHVIVSTDEDIFDVASGKATPLPFGKPSMSNFAHLASADGVLLVAGVDESFWYDGKRWNKIFQL